MENIDFLTIAHQMRNEAMLVFFIIFKNVSFFENTDLFVSPDRFPNDILGFWKSKNLFASPDRFPNDILGFWRLTVDFVDYCSLDAQ